MAFAARCGAHRAGRRINTLPLNSKPRTSRPFALDFYFEEPKCGGGISPISTVCALTRAVVCCVVRAEDGERLALADCHLLAQ
jgi:hypothetical protein